MNTDYKIEAKSIANRIKLVLPNLINHDQTGVLKGRFIGENIRLINCIIQYTTEKNDPGLLLFIDFEKAFDSHEWSFIHDTLTSYGFGASLINWVKTLYSHTIYYAPDLNMESFIQDLDTSLSALPDNTELILLGDFNVNFTGLNLNIDKAMKRKLIHVTNSHELDQLINKPTQITERSSTLIDLLFSNTTHRVTDRGVIHLTISDHSMIFCVVKSGITKAPGKTIEYRSFKNYSKADFVNDLKDVDWESVANKEDDDSAVSTWNKLFTNIADRHAPVRKARTRGVRCPWMNSQLSQAMSQRNYLHRRAIKSNSPYLWSCYKKLKNYVNKEMQSAKRSTTQT